MSDRSGFFLTLKESRSGMKKVQELLATVQRFNIQTMPKRIFWFGIVCGIFETDDIKFNERAGDTLLEILRAGVSQ